MTLGRAVVLALLLLSQTMQAQAQTGESRDLIAAESSWPELSPQQDAALFNSLLGRWEGVAIRGGNRYVVRWEIGRRGLLRKRFEIALTTEDYRLHTKQTLFLKLVPGEKRGTYSAESEPAQSRRRGNVTTRVLPPQTASLFLNEARLVFNEGGGEHEARWTLVNKDKISYEYADRSRAGVPPVRGELLRGGQ